MLMKLRQRPNHRTVLRRKHSGGQYGLEDNGAYTKKKCVSRVVNPIQIRCVAHGMAAVARHCDIHGLTRNTDDDDGYE